jgi:hypothetical protein
MAAETGIANYYHPVTEPGLFTGSEVFFTELPLQNGQILKDARPIGFLEVDDDLVMVISTFEGKINKPVSEIQGFRVVRGDSTSHRYETDGELLIEITYLKVDTMEAVPRRIRPTAIMCGIHGNTEQLSAEQGTSHRAMGESADFYIEGHDTQYAPGETGTNDIRRFPFWRIGVWGNPLELRKHFLPQPQNFQQ